MPKRWSIRDSSIRTGLHPHPRLTKYASARIARTRYATTVRCVPLGHHEKARTAAIHHHSPHEHIDAGKPSRRVKLLTQSGCTLRQLLLSSWATTGPNRAAAANQPDNNPSRAAQNAVMRTDLSVHTGSWSAHPARRRGERLSRRARRDWRFVGGLCEAASQGPSDATRRQCPPAPPTHSLSRCIGCAFRAHDRSAFVGAWEPLAERNRVVVPWDASRG